VKERQQIVNIASAADAVSTLEHLVLHTLPAGEKLAGKGGFVPHMDVSYNEATGVGERTPTDPPHRVRTKPPISSKPRCLL